MQSYEKISECPDCNLTSGTSPTMYGHPSGMFAPPECSPQLSSMQRMTIGIASNMPKACPYINAGGRAYSLILDSYRALGIELNNTAPSPGRTWQPRGNRPAD